MVNDLNRFDRLSPRHRDCLRGVCELKGSKEIAEQLGIEKSTVDSYLTDAVKILGARNRRDAALQWAAYQAETGALSVGRTALDMSPANRAVAPNGADVRDGVPPDKIGGDSARLAGPAAILPPVASPDEMIVGAPGVSGELPFRSRSAGFGLPFRRKGQRGNDLTVGDRLIWIQAIALGIAIGFGMLMTGLQVLTGLIETVTQRLS